MEVESHEQASFVEMLSPIKYWGLAVTLFIFQICRTSEKVIFGPDVW